MLIDGLRRNRELASVDAMKRCYSAAVYLVSLNACLSCSDFDAYIQKMDGQMQKIKDDISGGIAPLDSVASKARYAQLCEFRDLLEVRYRGHAYKRLIDHFCRNSVLVSM